MKGRVCCGCGVTDAINSNKIKICRHMNLLLF